MAKLPYFFIVDNEKCTKLAKLIKEKKMGKYRYHKECGKFLRRLDVLRDYPVLDIVIASRDYAKIVMEARSKALVNRKRSVTKTVKMPKELAEIIENYAKEEGITFSEALRQLLIIGLYSVSCLW